VPEKGPAAVRGSIIAAALMPLCFALFFAAPVSGSDVTLQIEYYHELKLMGVPAVQRGKWLVKLHPPNSTRIDIEGSSYPVIYRYEEGILYRYEINKNGGTYSKVEVAEARRQLRDKMRQSGMKEDVQGPGYITAGAEIWTGWREVFREKNEVYLHYLLSGRIVAAAVVDETIPCPSETLILAVANELPFYRHYWVADAFAELMSKGLVTYFEYAPPGPEYYHFHVTLHRQETMAFTEDFFLPPEGFRKVAPDENILGTPREKPATKENQDEGKQDNRLPRASGVGGGNKTAPGTDANPLIPLHEPGGDDKQGEN